MLSLIKQPEAQETELSKQPCPEKQKNFFTVSDLAVDITLLLYFFISIRNNLKLLCAWV